MKPHSRLWFNRNIGDLRSKRSVESNAVAGLLFDPTVDQIEAMPSELCRLKRCDSDSLNDAEMVLMKLVLEVDAPWEIRKITTQSVLLPPLPYLKIPMEELKPRLLRYLASGISL